MGEDREQGEMGSNRQQDRSLALLVKIRTLDFILNEMRSDRGTLQAEG